MVTRVTDAAVRLPDGRLQAAPADNPLIPEDGVLGATGGATRTEILQPDRTATTTPPAATTPAVIHTGPVTDVPETVAANGYFQSPEYLRKDAEIQRRSDTLSQWQGVIQRKQATFDEPWNQAKADLDDATAKLDTFDQAPKFMRYGEDGRGYSWALRDPATGQVQKSPRKGPDGREISGQDIPTPYDTDDLIRWQRDRADLAANRDRARQAYDKLRPSADQLEATQSRIKENRLGLASSRIRHQMGLPDEDAGVAMTLARAEENPDEKSHEQQAAASLVTSPPDPRGSTRSGASTTAPTADDAAFASALASTSGTPDQARADDAAQLAGMAKKTAATAALASGKITFRPLLPAEEADQTAVFSRAFDGLTQPGELAVGDTGDGYAFIRGGGGNIGSLQKDRDGSPFVVLSNSSRPGDLSNHANLGTIDGIPVYLRDNHQIVHDQTKEARYVTGIFNAVRSAPDAATANARLAAMGASADEIARKVRSGEISIQHGEALARGVFHTTLRAGDPGDPASFSPWLSEPAFDPSHFYQKQSGGGVDLPDSNPVPSRDDESRDIGSELAARDLAASKALESPPPFGKNAAQLEKNLVTGNLQIHERDLQGQWSSPGERQQFIADYNERYIAPLRKAVREDQAMARQVLERDGANQSHAARMKLVTDAGGGGTGMKELSGVEPGFFESLKDAFNNPISKNTSERIGDALARAGGDIPKAIGIIKSTPPRERSSDFTDAESPFALMASPDEEDLAQAAAGLQALKDRFDKDGLTPEEQKAVVSDAGKAGYWTENDTDLVRELSTGELRISPGFLFGDKQRIIDAINRSGTDDIDKKIALLNLDSARERMQGKLFRATLTNDSGFKAFAHEKWRPGRDDNDKAAILDAWAIQQKNRAWVFQAGDAVWEGVKSASVGIDKTLVGTGAGLLGLAGAGADLVGLDGTARMARNGSGYLGGIDNEMGNLLQGQKEAARFRGQTGGLAFTSDVVSAVGQALPMMVGGEIAAGLKGISKAVVGGMAIYGYGAAQGYEASVSDAIATATARKQSALNQEELGKVLGDPKTQIGGFVSAIAAAALSKAFPQGIERAALGKAVGSMTVRDFVTGGGLDAMRKGVFGQEIRAMGKTLFADARDQALQGFLNHVVSEIGNAAAHGKDIRLGDLLGDALYSSGIAATTGTIPSQARKTGGPSLGGETNPATKLEAAQAKFDSLLAKHRQIQVSDPSKTKPGGSGSAKAENGNAGSDLLSGLEQKYGKDKLDAAVSAVGALRDAHAPYKPGFDTIVRKIADEHHATALLAELKGIPRSAEKVLDQKSGTARVKDIVRGSIVARSPSDVAAIAASVKKAFPGEMTIKDRFAKPLPGGYRDMMMTV